MRPLVIVHLVEPDLEDVWIIPMAWSREFFQPVLLEADQRHLVVVTREVIGVGDVGGGAPHIRSNFGPPPPDALQAILGEAINHGPPTALDSVVHLPIRRLHFLGLVDIACCAPVVLQEIYAPPGEGLGVLVLVSKAALELFAVPRPG